MASRVVLLYFVMCLMPDAIQFVCVETAIKLSTSQQPSVVVSAAIHGPDLGRLVSATR